MKLSHSTNDDFFRLLIYAHPKCWILSLEFCQCLMHFCCSIFVGCFYCVTHHRLRNKHALTFNNIVHVSFSECLAGGTVTTKNSKNITCLHFWNVLHLICMHFSHSGNFQFFAEFIAPNIISLFYFSLVNSHIAQLTKPWLLHFENIANKWFFLVNLQYYLFFCFLICFIFSDFKATVLFVSWRWEIFKDSI